MEKANALIRWPIRILGIAFVIGNLIILLNIDNSAAFLHGNEIIFGLIIFNIAIISLFFYLAWIWDRRREKEHLRQLAIEAPRKALEESMILDLIKLAEDTGLNLVNELNLNSLYEEWRKGNWNQYGLWHNLEQEIGAWTHAIQIKQKVFEREIYDDLDLRPTYEQKQKAWDYDSLKFGIIKTTEGPYEPGMCMRCGTEFFENNFRAELPLGFYWASDNSGKLLILCSECAPKMKVHTSSISEPTRSRHISESVKDSVWNRDRGKCVECGSNEKLEFDHIIPFSKGGSNTKRNIQLLCEACNRSKSNRIG